MTKELFATNGIFALVGAAIVGALGGWDIALQVLVALIATDYITGVVIALKNKNLSSEVGFWGLFRKIMIFALIYVSVLLDSAAGTNFLRTLTILFYISNEGISVLENATVLGVPFPDQLKNVLVQLKKPPGGDKSAE